MIAGKRDDLDFRARDGWFRIEDRSVRAAGDPLSASLGRPGLWKALVGDHDTVVADVFEIPASVLDAAAANEGAGEGRAAIVAAARDWARATRPGGTISGWRAPDREDVEFFLPSGALLARCEGSPRQGGIVREDGRLALVFPVLPRLAADLSSARREWLRALLLDAQNNWRLVRIGVAATGETLAEVDLTGAPHAIVEPLVVAAADALRCVVEWLEPTVGLLADRTLASRALESAPARALRPT